MGEARSYPRRAAAATVLKNEMDRLRAEDPSIKMLAMGDLNDDPVSPSVRKVLGSVGDPEQLSDKSPYYNLMTKM